MSSHIPVMLDEVIEQLGIRDGNTYIDCTFGAGGYSRKILASANCKLYSIDQDPGVEEFVNNLTKDYSPERFVFIKDNFANLENIALEYKMDAVDGIVLDLGISSMQVDQAERGFSFQKDARLDMRMSQEGVSAWDVINTFKEEDLADIIYYYGEERLSRRIAKRIIESRLLKPIDTTLELAKIIHSSMKKQGKTDSATKTFQAIRVYVNDELKALKIALASAYALLKPSGKLVIVSFQGLENIIIKEFIGQLSNISSKSLKPTPAEIKLNPRSRSAKLRSITKAGV